MKKYYFLSPFLLLVMIHHLFAQEELTPVTKTFAIKNAYIIQKPGQVLDLGAVVIKNGLIDGVGKNLRIPSNAKILAADSMYIYAGFIDGISHAGIPEPEAKKSTGRNRREKDAANPSYEKAGIQPQLQVRDLLHPKDKSISTLRQLGYTAAHVVPRGKMLPGTGSLILLNGKKADDFIYQENASLFAQLKGAGNVFPATLIAVMSKFRELYQQSEQSKVNEKQYKMNPVGKARPTQDRVLQAFYPVLDKQQSVFFAAPTIKDIHRVFTLQKELNFPLVLTDVKQGWHLADKIKTNRTPILLSLDLPKDKSKKKKSSDKKEKTTDKKETAEVITKKKEIKPLTDFQKRQQKALQQYKEQAAFFQNKGIDFGFTAISTKPANIRANLRTMIKHGLKEETALAALTTIPAKQLGISQTMGTIEKGKLANLVITDKPYFEEKSNIRFVLVEGQVFEYAIKKKKSKTDKEAMVKLAGVWNYTIEIPGTSSKGVITLLENNGTFSGTITNDMGDGAPREIGEIDVEGNEISFSVPTDDTGSTMVDINIIVQEDAMEGTVVVPGMGSFDLEGARVPN